MYYKFDTLRMPFSSPCGRLAVTDSDFNNEILECAVSLCTENLLFSIQESG